MDEAFGFIGTVEKTVYIFMLTLDHVKNVVSDGVIKGHAML